MPTAKVVELINICAVESPPIGHVLLSQNHHPVDDNGSVSDYVKDSVLGKSALLSRFFKVARVFNPHRLAKPGYKKLA